jgi:hypothetical protein
MCVCMGVWVCMCFYLLACHWYSSFRCFVVYTALCVLHRPCFRSCAFFWSFPPLQQYQEESQRQADAYLVAKTKYIAAMRSLGLEPVLPGARKNKAAASTETEYSSDEEVGDALRTGPMIALTLRGKRPRVLLDDEPFAKMVGTRFTLCLYAWLSLSLSLSLSLCLSIFF